MSVVTIYRFRDAFRAAGVQTLLGLVDYFYEQYMSVWQLKFKSLPAHSLLQFLFFETPVKVTVTANSFERTVNN